MCCLTCSLFSVSNNPTSTLVPSQYHGAGSFPLSASDEFSVPYARCCSMCVCLAASTKVTTPPNPSSSRSFLCWCFVPLNKLVQIFHFRALSLWFSCFDRDRVDLSLLFLAVVWLAPVADSCPLVVCLSVVSNS